MASKLVLTMTTSDGEKNFSYNYANPSATTANVKAVGQALITHGSIFENVPTEFKAAKIVTTTETVYDLSN